MTTIHGVWRMGRAEGLEACAQMGRAMQPYGADQCDTIDLGEIALGRNLLRLVPEDAFDRQPLTSPDGRYALVADLRLDNRDSLLTDLGLEAEAGTMSDAAILLAAFLRWGPGCCDRLVGEFAFAVWDAQRREVTLACDFAGARPLFFHINRALGLVAFASLPSGLHALRDIPRGVDADELEYMVATHRRRAWRSGLAGLSTVASGHYIQITETGETRHKHWTPDLTPLILPRHEEYAARLEEAISAAIRSVLRGQTEVATCLSSGYDSSCVTLGAARHLEGAGQVHAYTAAPRLGYTGGGGPRRVDESTVAAQTCALRPNLDHHIVRPGEYSFLDSLDWIIPNFQDFGALTVNQRLYDMILSDAQRRGLRVLLDASAGNLSFSETGRSLLTAYLLENRFAAFAGEAARRLVRRQVGLRQVLSLMARRALGRSRLIPGAAKPSRCASAEAVARYQHEEAELDWSYQGILLRHFEQATPGFHQKAGLRRYRIDIRDPLRDRRVVELALRIPQEQHCHGGRPRALAHAILSRQMPRSLLDQLGRGRQSADWPEQFLREKDRVLAEYARMDEDPVIASLVDVPRLRQAVEDIPEGAWDGGDVVGLYSVTLYQGLSVAAFVRHFSGAETPPDRS